ncbi:MAG: WXG100 family type VII secretion target [Planctomycetota bacterium]|nr:WXG100 family type VII secretion target [Planctomycetota bacterium]
MAKAIVDPVELHRFAVELKRFNTDLQGQVTTLHRQFTKLGETWRDQEHAKFAEEFEQITKALMKFVEASDKQVPMLLRKAERIRDYLEQR